jgi:hypothetical protein
MSKVESSNKSRRKAIGFFGARIISGIVWMTAKDGLRWFARGAFGNGCVVTA